MAIVDYNPKIHARGRPRWRPHSGLQKDIAFVGSEFLEACTRMTDSELFEAKYKSWETWDLAILEERRRKELE